MPFLFFNTVPNPTETGPGAIVDANTNLMALRDSIISGTMAGWPMTVVPASNMEEPNTLIFNNATSTLRLVADLTWTAGYLTGISWQLWDGPTQLGFILESRVYDSNHTLTSTTGSGGLLAWVTQWIGKFKDTRATLASHMATGAGSHGFGTLALQNANAASITGGNVTVDRIVYVNSRAAIGFRAWASTIDFDWNYTWYDVAISGPTNVTFSNLPVSVNPFVGDLTLELYMGAGSSITFPVGTRYPGGVAPALTIPGTNLLTFSCSDGTTVRLVGASLDSR